LPAGLGNGWIRLDATAVVQQWVSGAAPNDGLLLRPSGGEYTYHYYHSREAATPTLRPRLVVTYTVGLQAAPQALHLAPGLRPAQAAEPGALHRQDPPSEAAIPKPGSLLAASGPIADGSRRSGR
ncbi:MAG: DNRLRE domain-containing protein, partial [Chloroflexia bacterium]|nr:DNRLRE domain-containing protein [Chloroflexia bacterium]